MWANKSSSQGEFFMTVVVLHLSDIHIRGEKDPILQQGRSIAACTFEELPEASAVFVVGSGDIAFSGKSVQYEAATRLFVAIRETIQAEKDIPVHFVLAPGNHDCDFDLDSKPRQLTLSGVRANPEQLDKDVIQLGVAVQKSYRDFVEILENDGETRVGDLLWKSHRFTVEGKELVFDTLNVSWCSSLHEEQGSLVFPPERYKHLQTEHSDLRVVVMHHPLNWFSQSMYHPLRQLIRGLSNVVITGHEHVGGAGEDVNADSGHSAYIEGCELQGNKGLSGSSFNVAVFDLEEGAYLNTRYLWNGLDHYTATEEGSWADFRTLPKKTANRFEVEPDFAQRLTDPGGVFGSKGSPIALQDLYVYPDVQEQQSVERKNIRTTLSTTIFQDASRLEGGVLLTGEEKAGATSLMYMLYRHYHDRALLPLYVRGADIKSASDRDIDQVLRRAVVEQYGERNLELFAQHSKAAKVLLLDDFDEGPIRHGQQRAKVLIALSERFRKMLVSANEIFDFNGTVRPHAEGKLSDLRQYQLLPFGYARRASLVRRWLKRTATDGSLTEDELLQRSDRAERMLDAVMAKNIVPSLPLYLLTLLQSLDSGVSGSFDDSGLGEYYHFLFDAGLEAAHVPKNQWNHFLEYCSHLAWQLHATDNKELTGEELRLFNDRYSKDQNRVDLEPRIAALVKARILAKNGDCIRFRYHYIYYYLKGRFLSNMMGDLAVQAYVRSCCAHLYVRENANTVLFLAHHAFKNPVFIDCVTEAIDKPFVEFPPVAFNGRDTEKVKEFVRDLPKLVYTGQSPEKAREEANQRRDELADEGDGLADKKDDIDENDFMAQLISLFKTVEILGQILKNQIASLSRNERVDLLTKVLKGPLRGVSAYFTLFTKDQAAAQVEIAELLAKNRTFTSEEDRQKAARQLLAWLLQTASAGFILKAVVSISSDELLEDIHSAAASIGSPAARLIATGVKLDSPSRIPQREMGRLMEDLKDDFVATRVLQILTLRRLYMFKTEEADRQWLASKGLITLQHQHAVEFQTRKSKLLKSS